METQTQQHQKCIEKQKIHEVEKNNHSIQLEQSQTTSPKHPSSSSSTSSPTHEFSFTISLHSNSKPSPSSSLALDLSPADDIFFHGHLLPLHLLSHFPSSPRFSTNSNDSFTLPIRDLENEKIRRDAGSCNTSNRENIYNNNSRGIITKEENRSNSHGAKASSFSLFGLTKGNHNKENSKPQNKKKVVGYDVIQALKKYFFRGKREKNQFHGEAYSRSGNLMRKNKPELRGSRGEYSAPASMRTSPTNSGLLLAKSGALSASSSHGNDSTMEELHAAIQAAIAHCKNSIAKEDKLN
ncbi:BRI1 kinase inhibitor 1 [Trifolium pratense]|uniref:BRI1 kinase inhibitor 1 n=1 Tax=Trifolium pratense TaxID=57577 RepID=UPI001E6944DC|nr:BRI1 kinase inhibitor 1 [Trifolium pratense]